MLVSVHISDEKNIKAIRSLDEELRPKQYEIQSGQPSPNVAKQNHVLSNLHPMIFVFTSPLHVGGNTIEKLGISGNLIDIFEPSTMLNRASLDVDECKFKIPLDEEDLQDFEWYKEPGDMLFKNFEYAVSLFWNMQRGLQEYDDGFDEEGINELIKYSDTINMYLKPKGIEADIDEKGWVFIFNTKRRFFRFKVRAAI